ncbi:Radical S-adenosyl methionine domain-containing protein 1, mitochondrial [Stylophora pistillata]|uniref:Radical S-adenosyl methionine domain-containing protein 1, mitochondrial n=1 Tax=Stylophora pistillata TaxID=50429 RepID=A0A2B4SFS6_STYPI|nr:Radical S-adenosyl methionine domain-containing protein 1, mitochondrial [Stylophora pistillata]
MSRTRSVGIFGEIFKWPYCRQICSFCNFNKYISKNVDHYRMRKCLVTETENLLKLSGVKKITSVYFGGGTPSLAEPLTISSVLEAVSTICYLPSEAEVTLEANPTSAETDKLGHFLVAGINRVSLGVQAFNTRDLLLLGRDNTIKDSWNHFLVAGINRVSLGVQAFNTRDLLLLGRDNTIKDSWKALQAARSIFPGKVSVDLMFGRPQQTVDDWYKELLKALSVCDDHISLYQLTLERGTPLYKNVTSGKVSLPDSDLAAEMYQLAVEGAESRHNLSYWYGSQYVGVGPGAHGRFIPFGNGNGLRQARVQTLEPNQWMTEVETRGHGTRKEVMQTKFEILEEVLMMSLRTADGLSSENWKIVAPFGLSLYDAFKDNQDVKDLIQDGLLCLTKKGIKATHRGLSVVDSIVSTLLLHLDGINRTVQKSETY